MKLLVDTPFGEIIHADATEVVAPGEAGEIGLLPGHTPVVTLLDIGALTYRTSGGVLRAAVASGYVEVSGDTVRIVTEACEPADVIDVARAKEAEERAQAKLAEVPLDAEHDAQRQTWQRALKRARARQSVAK
jgi:F-type H+-transporting ATPase subunit epsilon